jgi:hypothetical protein
LKCVTKVVRSLTVKEEHKLRMFENRVLRRIFGPKRDGESCITRSFIICALLLV